MIRQRSAPFIENALKAIAQERVVLDVGGGRRFDKWLAPYASWFKDCDYRTFDVDSTTGADVIGDIHQLPLADESVDAVICSSVLEHVRDPHGAMREVVRILRPGGKLYLYVPSLYPYHARPGHYPDYWRFFEDTVHDLCTPFRETHIHKQGGYFLALSFFVPFQHRLRFILTPLADFLDGVFRTHTRSTTAGYYVYAVK